MQKYKQSWQKNCKNTRKWYIEYIIEEDNPSALA